MIFLGINIYLIILKMANNLVRQFYKIKVYYPRTTHLFYFLAEEHPWLLTHLTALSLCQRPSSTREALYSIATSPLPRLNRKCSKPSAMPSARKSPADVISLLPLHRSRPSGTLVRNLMFMSTL